MSALGFESFFVCAHDRGARKSHKLCVDYPQHIRKAIFLDICPTLHMYPSPTFDLAKTYFHWFFLIQKESFPETLVASNARKSAEMFLAGGEESQLTVFDKECLEYYIGRLGNDKCIHGMCQDYRASASIDLDEACKDEKEGKKVQCQLLILWSKDGLLQRSFKPLKLWGAMAMDPGLVSGRAVDSGHFIPENAPLEVINAIEEFLR